MITLACVVLYLVVYCGVAVASEKWSPAVGIGGLVLVLAIAQLLT